ncbi:MAG TPA: glycosyltransferase family 9 protein [Bryobacteraceae bacterium]|nr:glycosyltransferase family 9 protein [Bryobacteraceae bacterium]
MTSPNQAESVLILRLGAMGDMLHALPAVASLKRSFPERRLIWTMAPKWIPLVEGNPYIDEVVPFDRRDAKTLMSCWRRLREIRPEWAIDFQGLIQSALVARAARPKQLFGFDKTFVREPLAAAFYSRRVVPAAAHVVDRNLELAVAAGANVLTREAWLPAGHDVGALPEGRFVLTNPMAGWKSKQWPLANYSLVAKRLQREGVELVANVPGHAVQELQGLKDVRLHSSSIAGLIAATRRASAVLGLDSGPLHLAAALHKPGVALFGPTDPARNGPYGGTIQVIRAADAQTTYKRGDEIHPSMEQIRPEHVAEELLRCLAVSDSEPMVRV